jgi:hypothetical protein
MASGSHHNALSLVDAALVPQVINFLDTVWEIEFVRTGPGLPRAVVSRLPHHSPQSLVDTAIAPPASACCTWSWLQTKPEATSGGRMRRSWPR